MSFFLVGWVALHRLNISATESSANLAQGHLVDGTRKIGFEHWTWQWETDTLIYLLVMTESLLLKMAIKEIA